MLKHKYLIGVALALIAMALFIPTLGFGFSPMDDKWVLRDFEAYFKKWSYLPSLFTVPLFAMYYRPMFLVSMMVDQLLGNGEPWMFHLTNCLLHGIACFLLFTLLLELKANWKSAAIWTLLFAFNPMNVHAIAWVPGRNDTLLAVFTLLSLFCLLRINQGKIYWIGHVLGFILALFTKENAITLPLVFLGVWWWRTSAKERPVIAKVALGYFTTGIVWFFTRLHIINFFPSAENGLFLDHLGKWALSLWLYLGKALFPFKQGIMPLIVDISIWPAVMASLLIVLLIVTKRIDNLGYFLMGLGWFFFFLAIPAWAGVNGNGEQYEHRMYLPMMGLAFAGIQLKGRNKLKRLNELKRPNELKMPKVLIGWVLIGLVLLVFGTKQVMRSQVYKSDFSFARAAANESPGIAFLHNMVGVEYQKIGDFKTAQGEFEKAIALKPNQMFYANLGAVYLLENELDPALKNYSIAIAMNPKVGEYYFKRSLIYYSKLQIDSAAADLQRAGQLHAKNIPAGYIADVNKAFQENLVMVYTKKIMDEPALAKNYNIRGVAYFNLGQFEKALIDFEDGLKIEPKNPELLANKMRLIKRGLKPKN